jgi:NADH-quinone oxidoreductase subunit F
MDLHVIGPLASPVERAAVDAVLGPPESGWVGGRRDSATEGHAARGGHATRSHRTQLLPALHAVQSRIGWISQPALNYICRRLAMAPAEAYGVATFYALYATTPRPPELAHVCDDIACRLAGAEAICADLSRTLGEAGEPARDGSIGWLRSPCLGLCDLAPAALVTVAGEAPSNVSLAPTDAVAIVARLEAGGRGASRPSSGRAPSVPGQAGTPATTRLLRRVGAVDPTSLEAYRADGGYEALRTAFRIGPEAVVAEVTASKLMGRGGAAFPTGRKWAAVAAQPAQPHYLVCNADESEPGTFKDRVLLEGDPFAIVEAMTIAAFATGAWKGYLYIRGEYPEAEARIAGALAAARAAGLLGADFLGSGFDFDVELRRGAGAYICGEETALFESIEGKRGEPRNKPPFPVEVGLFGKPTVVNNVETLANVPLILALDPSASGALSVSGNASINTSGIVYVDSSSSSALSAGFHMAVIIGFQAIVFAMFTKVFGQIFDSSIAEDYNCRRMFMDLLVLADQTGAVDMTYEAISRRTNVPVEEVVKYVKQLCQPDAKSRSPLEEGKRLVPLDSNREWGWQIVNYVHYRNIRDEAARREYFRDKQREHRKKNKKQVFDSETVSTPSNFVKDLSASASSCSSAARGSSSAASTSPASAATGAGRRRNSA